MQSNFGQFPDTIYGEEGGIVPGPCVLEVRTIAPRSRKVVWSGVRIELPVTVPRTVSYPDEWLAINGERLPRAFHVREPCNVVKRLWSFRKRSVIASLARGTGRPLGPFALANLCMVRGRLLPQGPSVVENKLDGHADNPEA